MNPYENAEFRAALEGAFVEAIKKVGFGNFKRISWFASNEQAQATKRAA
ncbi:hypothetical protein Q3C01_23945 [Bradyrhizobium sp. UFLA05-109]